MMYGMRFRGTGLSPRFEGIRDVDSVYRLVAEIAGRR